MSNVAGAIAELRHAQDVIRRAMKALGDAAASKPGSAEAILADLMVDKTPAIGPSETLVNPLGLSLLKDRDGPLCPKCNAPLQDDGLCRRCDDVPMPPEVAALAAGHDDDDGGHPSAEGTREVGGHKIEEFHEYGPID